MEWIKRTVPCLEEGWGQHQEDAGTTVFHNILHSHLPVPIPRFTVPNPANGGADTASLLLSDLGQLPVIDLICASPDSGVVHDDFNPLSSTSHSHLVASSSHNHSPPPRKTVQSHSILVNENQSTCTSNHSTAPSVVNVLDSMDIQPHLTIVNIVSLSLL